MMLLGGFGHPSFAFFLAASSSKHCHSRTFRPQL
uniref:Uncharacterized protein n=1 Tax=Anguilla anguilla TaxID=7936 RepID=A0A0E9W9V6_ANGAN